MAMGDTLTRRRVPLASIQVSNTVLCQSSACCKAQSTSRQHLRTLLHALVQPRVIVSNLEDLVMDLKWTREECVNFRLEQSHTVLCALWLSGMIRSPS